jgi:hypothetical protein
VRGVMQKRNRIYFSLIIILLISNISFVLFHFNKIDFNTENYLGYVTDNKITIGRTTNSTCIKSELEYKTCSLSIPQNEFVDIIFDGKNGWYYGNWKYGKISVWGWIEARSIVFQ